MKVESYMLSDNEFLCSVEMFITEQFDRGARKLIDLDGSDRKSFVEDPPTEMEPTEILQQCDKFLKKHKKWWVFEMWCMGEFCGLIAFQDWQ